MRRGLAAVVLGLSLVIGSIAWSGFILSRTLLDPERSERLADQMFENPQLRSALAGQLADGLERALGVDAPVDRTQIEAAATLALDDPSVQAVVRDGLVSAHRNALEGESTDTVLDVGVLGESLRSSLVTQRPELDASIPAAPAVEIELPTRGLSFLGTIRSFVLRVTWITGILAIAGALIALIITTNRAAVLRRVSFWAFAAAAFWLLVGYGLPWLMARIAPAASEVSEAAVDVFFGAMIPPAITLAVIGAGLLALSFVWAGAAAATDGRAPRRERAGRAVEPEPTHDPRRTVAAPHHQQTAPTSGTVRATRPQTTADGTRVMPTQAPVTRPTAHPGTPNPAARPTQATPPVARPTTGANPIDPTPSPEPRRRATRWVEGIGYVDSDGNRVEPEQ